MAKQKQRSTRKQSRATAIDVGAHSIKLATVRAGEKGKLFLDAWTMVPVEGEPGDLAAQQRALHTAVSRHGGLVGTVVSTIPRQRVVVRYITLPSVVPSEIDEIMNLEVERHSPISSDEVEMGYSIIAERSGTESDVLMVAAPRGDLTRHVDMLSGAGIEPTIIDVAGMNVGLAYHDERHTGEQIAVLDIGRTQITVSVWRGGFTRFSRSTTWGAEQLRGGLENADDPISLADLNGEADAGRLAAHPGWRDWCKRLTRELRRTFTAFEHEHAGAPIRRVYLSGGLGESPAVVDALRKSFDFELLATSPAGHDIQRASGIEPPPPPLADAIGTAVRAVTLGDTGANLLPRAVVAARRTAHRKTFLRNAAILLVGALIFLGGSFFLQWKQRNDQLNAIQDELAVINPRVRHVRTLKDKLDRIDANTDKQNSAFQVLHAVYTALPEGSNITRFEFTKKDELTIRGDVFTDNDVLRLGEILRGLKHFREVNQGPIQRKPIPGTNVIAREYEFRCVLISKEQSIRKRRR